MNEVNEGNNVDASVTVPVKRRRGRPRKYPSSGLYHGGNAYVPRYQNLSFGDNAHAPPGFRGVNVHQPRHVDPLDNANDVMVGQVVHGVIEAAFNAGYLLTVRVGNSETTLRGVVFKPGHYVPVTADNDIAPGVKMIRRNEILIPRENYTQVHGHTPQSRDRNEAVHAAGAADPIASKGKQVPSVAIQSAAPGVLRGNVVPVVLQPVNLSNGSTAATKTFSAAVEATPLVASQGKQVLDATHPSHVLTPTKQVPAFQDNQQTVSSGAQIETTLYGQNPEETLQKVDAKSMDLRSMPFEKLLNEVMKRSISSELTQSNSSSASKLSVKDSGLAGEDDASDTSQTLSAEPLQSLVPNLHNQPAAAVGNYRTGKMTELLQALKKVLQDNMTENQVTRAEEPAVDSRLKLDEHRIPETDVRDDDDDDDDDEGHSKKQSRVLFE